MPISTSIEDTSQCQPRPTIEKHLKWFHTKISHRFTGAVVVILATFTVTSQPQTLTHKGNGNSINTFNQKDIDKFIFICQREVDMPLIVSEFRRQLEIIWIGDSREIFWSKLGKDDTFP